MIKINLLPHREEARKARRQQFYTLTGMVLALGALIVFAGYTAIDGYVQHQESKNQFLKKEIEVLDKQVEEIKDLKEKSQALLDRKNAIESLQKDRGETVYLLNELVQRVPEGVYLTTMKQSGLNITISGYAQSNSRISTLMRNLEAAEDMGPPRLIESKAAMVGGRRLFEFSLTFNMERTSSELKDESSAKGKQGAKS